MPSSGARWSSAMGVPGSRALQGAGHIPAFTHQLPVLPPPQLLCVVRCRLGHMLMWSLKGQGRKTRGQVAHAKGLGGPGQGRKEDLRLGCEGSTRNWPGRRGGQRAGEMQKCEEGKEGCEGRRPGPNLSVGWGLHNGVCTT